MLGSVFLKEIENLTNLIQSRADLIRQCEEEAATHRLECLTLIQRLEEIIDLAGQQPKFKVIEGSKECRQKSPREPQTTKHI